MENRKVTQTFANAAARAIAVPDAIGQLGVQVDTGELYVSTAVTAGSWIIGVGSGISSLNGLVTGTQTFASGTAGTDFAIVSAGSTHTFNLPTASALNRGALSSADWTTFNNKLTLPALTAGSVLFSNGTTIAQDNTNLFWDDTSNFLGIGTNSGLSARLHVVSTGTTSATYTAKFHNSTGSSNSLVIQDDGTVGIGTATPAAYLNIVTPNDGPFALSIRNTTFSASETGAFRLFQSNAGLVNIFNNNLTFFTVSATGLSTFFSNDTNEALRVAGKDNLNTSYCFTTKGTVNFGLIVSNQGFVSISASAALPATSAALDIAVTDGALVISRLTATQASALTAIDGMGVYVTSTNGTFTSIGFWKYEAGAWVTW